MQNYQMTQASRNYGGARVVFTGTVKGVTSGQYDVDLTTLPEVAHGFVPAGTPVAVDDAPNVRTIKVHYAFEVVAGGTTTAVRVKKGWEGSRARVGMAVMVLPATVATAGKSVAITAVDRTNADYDVITIATLGSLAAGTILVEADKVSDDAAKIKVLPNAFLFYDVVKDPNAINMWGVDALYAQVDGVLLTRRVPPIAPIIREYMRENDVYVRYSNSRE